MHEIANYIVRGVVVVVVVVVVVAAVVAAVVVGRAHHKLLSCNRIDVMWAPSR